MNELLIERWLRRRVRAERCNTLVLAIVLCGGAFLAWNFMWFCLWVPVGMIAAGFGIFDPGIGANIVIACLIVGYFFFRQRRPLPVPEVTTLADTGEPALIIPAIREHWLRVRSRNQTEHLSIGSMVFDLIFATPMFMESAFSVFAHWRKLSRIDARLCARALAVIHSNLDRTSFATLQAALSAEDFARMVHQLWLLDDVQFINAPPQGLILTELARQELAAFEDKALIASVA